MAIGDLGNAPAADERVERRRNMQELNDAVEGRQVEGFQEYAAKMKALDDMMEDYSRPGPGGAPRPMTAEMKAALTQQIRETALAGERYLENAAKDPSVKTDRGVPGVVRRLQGLAARDLAAIEKEDPAKGRSLREVFLDARVRTVELGNREFTTLHNSSQTIRTPLTMVSTSGARRPGYFTAAMVIDPKRQYDEALEETVRQTTGNAEEKEKARSALMEVFAKYKQLRITKDPSLAGKPDSFFYRGLVHDMTDGSVRGDGKDGEQLGPIVKKNMQALGIDTISLGSDTFEAFGEQLKRVNTSLTLAEAQGLKVGDRVDIRSGAACAVAGLMGRPGLLAHSTPMRCRDSQGRVIEGTFTDDAKGYDLDGCPDTYAHVNDRPFDGGDGTFLRQLADIQVLAYLNGNADLHFGSMVYKTDEQGRFSGAQAFGNEHTFGRFSGRKAGLLPGPNDLNVISASMAEKIKAMDPAMLKFTLRGRGLSDEEIEFSAKRLTDLKEAIVKGEAYYNDPKNRAKREFEPVRRGFLRTVPDKDFKDFHISDLHLKNREDPSRDQRNIFSMVEKAVTEDLPRYRKMGFPFDPENNLETSPFRPKMPEAYELGSEYTVKRFTGALSGAFKLVQNGDFNVDNLTRGKRGTKKFADMVEAAKDTEQLQKSYENLEKRRQVMSETEYLMERRLLDQTLSKLESTNGTYLSYKTAQRKAPSEYLIKAKNPYEKARIDYALKVKEFCAAVREKFPKAPDKSEETREAFRAAGEEAEIADRRAFAEEMKKAQQPQQPQGPHIS